METKLQKLETTSAKTEFAEPIHSESSNKEAATTSENTELVDQITSKSSSRQAETMIPSNSDQKIIMLKGRQNSKVYKLHQKRQNWQNRSIRKVLTRKQKLYHRGRNFQIKALQQFQLGS